MGCPGASCELLFASAICVVSSIVLWLGPIAIQV